MKFAKVLKPKPGELKTAMGYRKAYESGRKAAASGFERVSTQAGSDPWLDWWFYAGFDQETVDEAWERFRVEAGIETPESVPVEVIN